MLFLIPKIKIFLLNERACERCEQMVFDTDVSGGEMKKKENRGKNGTENAKLITFD